MSLLLALLLQTETFDALRDQVGGRGLVLRGGSPVYSWGDVSKRSELGAAENAILGTLLMMAVQEGKLEGVDASVNDSTWRELAHRGRLRDPLLGKVYRAPGAGVLKSRLGDVLGFQDPVEWTSGLSLSTRDLARYGLLVLRGGTWGERQVLMPGLMYLSISAPVEGVHSFGWLLNGVDAQRRQVFPDGPGDLVAALGEGGKQALWILPSRDLVVAWSDASADDLPRAVRLMSRSASR